jgi:DmsE family decaheme c-type cytochrome
MPDRYRWRRMLHPLFLSLGLVLLLTGCFKVADTPGTVAQPPAPPSADDYVGAETCKGCHEESVHRFAETKMGKLFIRHPRSALEKNACENCHGPGKAHAEAPGRGKDAKLISFAKNDPTPVEVRNKVCLDCHSKGPRVFWSGSAHDTRDVACTGCHRVMTTLSSKAQLVKATEIETCGTCHLQKRAQQMRSSHMPLREGKMTCTSCHNAHGTISQALLKEPSINDSCFSCHTEKRGPFLWEHAPVVESCVNCHDPHGSNHEKLLAAKQPYLCQRCHLNTRHPGSLYDGTNTLAGASISNRAVEHACKNCHQNVHGGNAPSGPYLGR